MVEEVLHFCAKYTVRDRKENHFYFIEEGGEDGNLMEELDLETTIWGWHVGLLWALCTSGEARWGAARGGSRVGECAWWR